MAVITVKADQTAIVAKDSTIRVGDTWQAADNFVFATDKAGNPVAISQVTLSGEVNTKVAGDYTVVYSYAGQESKAVVHVLAMQESLSVKDSSIYVGDTWTASDNFISATDKAGNPIDFSQVKVSGTVNTAKGGTYEVTYKYGSQTQVAKISVKSDKSSLILNNTTISVGSSWTAADNFVSATDKAGNAIDFSKLTISGTVDTSKAGVYKVTYSLDLKKASMFRSLFSMLEGDAETLSGEAVITVQASTPTPDKENNSGATPNKENNSGATDTSITINSVNTVMGTTNDSSLPSTGEDTHKITSILGSSLLLSAIGGLLFKKKKKRS